MLNEWLNPGWSWSFFSVLLYVSCLQCVSWARFLNTQKEDSDLSWVSGRSKGRLILTWLRSIAFPVQVWGNSALCVRARCPFEPFSISTTMYPDFKLLKVPQCWAEKHERSNYFQAFSRVCLYLLQKGKNIGMG